MNIGTSWSIIKPIMISKGLSLQYVEVEECYYIVLLDGIFSLSTRIEKTSPASSEQEDFETNYKSVANKALSQKNSPFASKKTENGKSLFKREHGTQHSITTGSNTILFTIPYAWVKFIGVKVFNSSILDKCDLYVLDSTTGTYTGVPNYTLNQFGYNVNMAAGLHEEICAYDADLYLNMQIKIVYTSMNDKTIGINFNLNEVK